MSTSRPGRAALVLLAALVGGCVSSVPAGSPPGGATGSRSPAVAYPAASPTATEPAATVEPTVEPTLQPPPAATLIVGSAEAAGKAGSYVWAGGADSAPWLPASALDPVDATSRAEARVEVADGVAVETWTARAAPADDPTGSSPDPLGTGSGAPSFNLPDDGAWVVSVQAVFADGRGDATWYWYLVLD